MEELRLKIIEECNASGLPLEALVFVIRDIYRDAQESYQAYLKKQNTMQSEEPTTEE